MAERADKGIRHLAIEINATAEQQEKLRVIVKAAVTDLLPLREQARDARERGRTLLTQSTVDRAAIEAFRAEQIAKADAASKRLAQALADAADVLTPEQRQQIGAFIERHHDGMSFRGMGPGGPGFWHGPRGG
jgi:Spy/CpxP family protein refolding chaperone